MTAERRSTISEEQNFMKYPLRDYYPKGFFLAPSYVLLDPEIPETSRVLYGFLCCYINWKGEEYTCFPSQKTILHFLGMSKTTLLEALGDLIQRGLLIKHANRKKGSILQDNNVYELVMKPEGFKPNPTSNGTGNILEYGYGIGSQEVMQDTDLTHREKMLYLYLISSAGSYRSFVISQKKLCRDLSITDTILDRRKAKLGKKYLKLKKVNPEKTKIEGFVFDKFDTYYRLQMIQINNDKEKNLQNSTTAEVKNPQDSTTVESKNLQNSTTEKKTSANKTTRKKTSQEKTSRQSTRNNKIPTYNKEPLIIEDTSSNNNYFISENTSSSSSLHSGSFLSWMDLHCSTKEEKKEIFKSLYSDEDDRILKAYDYYDRDILLSALSRIACSRQPVRSGQDSYDPVELLDFLSSNESLRREIYKGALLKLREKNAFKSEGIRMQNRYKKEPAADSTSWLMAVICRSAYEGLARSQVIGEGASPVHGYDFDGSDFLYSYSHKEGRGVDYNAIAMQDLARRLKDS